MSGDVTLKKLGVAIEQKQFVAADLAILAHNDFEAVPPCNWVLFAPIVWGMEAYNIDTTVLHGTFT